MVSCGAEEKYYDLNMTLGLSVPVSSENFRQASKEALEDLNVEDIRVMMQWQHRQPNQGEYDFIASDQRFEFYKEHNLKPLVTLEMKYMPEWLNTLSQEEYLEANRLYFRKIISRYGDHIHMIQFGNEWDWEIDESLDLETFIELSNILYEEAKAYDIPVSLASISSGGLQSLSYANGSIQNVYFKEGPLYTEAQIQSMQDHIDQTVSYAKDIYSRCHYDYIDLHFYDDYWNWEIYLESIRVFSDKPIIASEFGGPHPIMEPSDESYRALQLYYYIRTLDQLNMEKAYYFKLYESFDPSEVYHPFSYLKTTNNKTTETYEMFKRFTNQ